MYKLSAVGAGHMGMAVLDGVVKTGLATPAEILVCEKLPERAALARQKGFATTDCECEAYAKGEYWLMAVLPQQCQSLLETLSSCETRQKPVIISIVSGVGSSYIRRYLGADTSVINIVPNITMTVGMGATAIARTQNITDVVLEPVVRVFDNLGETVVVEESCLTEIIAANGCAPGYAFYLIDAIARAVADQGVDYDLAVRMAAQSFAGAAQMVLTGEKPPTELLSQVCSPGGLTRQGVDYFDDNNLTRIMAGGIKASIDRGYELALKA